VATSRRSLLRAMAGGGALVGLFGAGACDEGNAGKGAAAVAPSAGQAGFFGGTDLAWVEINIAMNEQLLPLLTLAPTKASAAGVKTYASQVNAFSEQELTTLRQLHDLARLPTENPHEGMPMPGMVTPEQVVAAKAATGTTFDKLLLQHLRAHLEQGASLAKSEEKAGIEPQTLALAKQVLTNRATALTQLSAMTDT
jgi:uncharacterized protein (DUF305 family)